MMLCFISESLVGFLDRYRVRTLKDMFHDCKLDANLDTLNLSQNTYERLNDAEEVRLKQSACMIATQSVGVAVQCHRAGRRVGLQDHARTVLIYHPTLSNTVWGPPMIVPSHFKLTIISVISLQHFKTAKLCYAVASSSVQEHKRYHHPPNEVDCWGKQLLLVSSGQTRCHNAISMPFDERG